MIRYYPVMVGLKKLFNVHGLSRRLFVLCATRIMWILTPPRRIKVALTFDVKPGPAPVLVVQCLN